MTTEVLPLIVGIPGTTLDPSELAVLDAVRPAGIILFARNVSSATQVRSLVAGFEDLEPRPFVAVDLEGGLVNRLSSLWGELPSPARPRRGRGGRVSCSRDSPRFRPSHRP